MAKMLTKSILMPAALAAALEAEAREEKISLSELVREALANRINLTAIEASLMGRLDAQDATMVKIAAKLETLEAAESEGKALTGGESNQPGIGQGTCVEKEGGNALNVFGGGGLLREYVQKIDDRYQEEGPGGGLSGLAGLDRLLGDLGGGDMVVVAGRPGMGKTSLALVFAANVACEQKLPVVIYSADTKPVKLIQKLLSGVAKLDSHRLGTGMFSEKEWPRLTYGLGKLKDVPIWVGTNRDVGAIVDSARALHQQTGKLGLVVVDYVQLLSPDERNGNRSAELGFITRALKALAMELDCPVIAVSQVNRSVEQRQNKRPVMSDLRDAGSIEDDADVIIFIYRDEVYDHYSAHRGVAELIVAKNRGGPIGTDVVAFIGEYLLFESLRPREKNKGSPSGNNPRGGFSENEVVQ